MELIKVVTFISCLITLVNGVDILYEHVGSQKMRVKRDQLDVTTTEPVNGLSEMSVAGREAFATEAKEVIIDEVKEVSKVEGEEKHLGVITKPFEVISSIFKKKPELENYNYGNGNHHSSYYSSPHLNNVQNVQVPDHNTPINPQVDIYNKPQNGILNQHHQDHIQIYPLQTGSISSIHNQHQVNNDGGLNQNPHNPGNIHPLQSTPLNHPSQNMHPQNKPHHHHHASNKPQSANSQKPYIGDFIPFKTKPSQKPDIHDVVFFPAETHEPSKPHDAYFSQITQSHGNKPGLFSKPQHSNKPNHQFGSNHHDHHHSSAPYEHNPHQSNNKPSFCPQAQKPLVSGPGHNTNTNNNHGLSHGSNFQITTASGTKPQISDLFQKPSSSSFNSQPNKKPFLGSLFQKPNKPNVNQQSQKPLFGGSNKPQSSIFDKPSNGQIWYPNQGTTQFFGPTYQNPYYSYGPQFGYQGFHLNPWAGNYNQHQSQHYFGHHQPAFNPFHGDVQLSKPEFYNGNQKPTKKPLTAQTSFQGHTTLTRKQFLSLFKPVMALAAILKKPIILEPVINDVMSLQPHDGGNFGNLGPQHFPANPSTQGYQPFNKPTKNNPNFLKPQEGSWEMIRGNVGSLAAGGLGMAFGPIGPIVSSFSRPYISQAVHGLSGGYLAKGTGLNLEEETAPLYMLDGEDESQRQEFPVLLPLELLDGVSIVDDDDEKERAASSESKTVIQPNDDISATESIKFQQSTDEVTIGRTDVKDDVSRIENREDAAEVNMAERAITSEGIVQSVVVNTEALDKKLTETSSERADGKTETSTEGKEETAGMENSLIKFGLD